MGFYPIFLELAGRSCLVVGGGRVAERKVEGLLGAGARVTVVSPSLSGRLQALAGEGRISHVRGEYAPEQLDGFQLVFAAAGDPEVSAGVARDARRRGVWVNVADDPGRCDFLLPAVLRRGKLVVAVGTGGASPALSRAVREELEAHLTEEYAVLAEVAAEVREELRRRGRLPGAEAWRAALGPALRTLVAAGKREEARAYLLERLGAERCS